MNKDFENFELRLKTLREECREDFEKADTIFKDTYSKKLEEIFPRDILGAKATIAGRFIVGSVDNPENKDVFKTAVEQTINSLPLSADRKLSLTQNILESTILPDSLQSYFSSTTEISRDPFFALVEDFALDGDISKEEFLVLQQNYDTSRNFIAALESLPDNIKQLFHSHIALTLSKHEGEKKSEFESEFSSELQTLKERGISVEPVVVFVSRSFYKTPGKYRKYEHPKRRMRRTFKIALLRLLRTKLGNIDAKIMLDKFEAGESFEDMFMLLYKILEVVNEDSDSTEIFSLLSLDEDLQDDVFTAEENKQKVLAGESLVMSIASLFSRGDAKKDEQELEDGMLEKILDESTDIVGEDIHFNRNQDHAGIYAESVTEETKIEDEEEEELDYDTMSPETAYELLKRDFHKLEEDKRQAFLQGRYDDIDVYNDSLLSIELKLGKICKLLGVEL